MLNTFDITISGYPVEHYRLLDGRFKDIIVKHNSEIWYHVWKSYDEPTYKTINLVNIESFNQLSYPVVDIKIINKKTTWWQRFWNAGWNDQVLYDIKINVISIKCVTYVKMRSGDKYFIDESTECLKNALDECVWTAEFLKSIKK